MILSAPPWPSGATRWVDVFLPRVRSVRLEKEVSERLSTQTLAEYTILCLGSETEVMKMIQWRMVVG